MTLAAKVFAALFLASLTLAAVFGAEAQAPIRIGATLSQTGAYAANGLTALRSYQLCVKHTNDKGGVLGRRLELLIHDDGSDPATAVRLYERLVAQDKVDLVLGPYSSAIADAVASMTEKRKMPMVSPLANATSMYRKGRKFIFSVSPPPEIWFEGLIDLAVRKGLRTVALIHHNDLGGRTIAQGARELARKKGLEVVFTEAFAPESTEFSAILTKVRASNPDVLGSVPGSARASIAIIQQMKALSVNPRMYGVAGTGGSTFYEVLGRDAEFAYFGVAWLPELVEVRAGGLIPIARKYPGAREFVEAYRKEFPGADADAFAAGGYGGCQILVEAIARAGTLDGEKLRDAIVKMDHNTVFGPFRVDRDGVQIGHKFVLFQWQDGKRAVVWPEELAPATPRFPTPPWNQRP